MELRVRYLLQRRVPFQLLSSKNIPTVKAPSHSLVGKGIPFVSKQPLDFVELIMFLSFKSIFLYNSFLANAPQKD